MPSNRKYKELSEDNLVNFLPIWEAVTSFREKNIAPVDIYGCETFADISLPDDERHFHILVSTLLSSQTKDESTAACMNRLKKHGLTPQIICEMSIDSLTEILYGVGFHNNKAKYLKEVSKIIIESYSGKVPDKYEQLISLPGIGPKMANLVLQTAFNKVNGISVDTHMHRIFNRIGWVKTKSPNETKYHMEKRLPHSYWKLVNKVFVGFGQIICRPVNPKCSECVIRALCSHGRRRHKTGTIEMKYE